MNGWRRSLAVLAVVLGTAPARAQVPVLYHGFLTNARGEPVSGSIEMRFTLFDAATQGAVRWTETVTALVENGNLAVPLGLQVPLTADLFSGPTLHLAVQVGGESLSARQAVGAVPLALLAHDTRRLGGRAVAAASCAEGQVLVLSQGQWVCGDTGSGSGGLPGGCRAGEVAKWNGSDWVCGEDEAAGVAAERGLVMEEGRLGLQACPADGDVLKYNVTAGVWECQQDIVGSPGTTYSAGDGLRLSGTTFALTNACSANQILKWGGSAWACAADQVGSGTVTSVAAGPGLAGGTITTSGTLSIDATMVPLLSAANTFTGGNTFSSTSNSFTGNGASLTNLNAGNITAGTLPLARGGTGATAAAAARANLGAAASGANADITSLSGLTTALSVGQGGTGATTAAGALTNLGAAASGANADITSLSGLTTALSVGQGGTGATTAAGALTNLGAASSARSIATGTGLTGGGNLTADRTLQIDTTVVPRLGVNNTWTGRQLIGANASFFNASERLHIGDSTSTDVFMGISATTGEEAQLHMGLFGTTGFIASRPRTSNSSIVPLALRTSNPSGTLTDRVFITRASASDNSTRVGINTATPGFTLEVNGTAAKTGGGSWTDTSDRRIKTDLRPIDRPLERMLAIRGIRYRYKHPEVHGDVRTHLMGFIAQDVEPHFPEWVGETDPKGRDREEVGASKVKTIGFIGFEALTVEAVRELKRENDSLRRRLGEQGDRLRELERRLRRLEALAAEQR